MATSGVALSGGKLGFKALTPYGKFAFYTTIFFVLLLAVIGTVESINQKSWYPFAENTLFRWVGSDHMIGKDIESLKNAPQFVSGVSVFSKQWWSNFNPLWYRLKFWFSILFNVYFMFLIIYIFYKIFSSINTSLPMLNVVLAIGLFAMLQIVVGLAFFSLNLDVYYPVVELNESFTGTHAVIIPTDEVELLNDMFGRSYPFEGLVSLVSHMVDGDLFSRTDEFEHSLVGKLVLDVPDKGLSINSTGV